MRTLVARAAGSSAPALLQRKLAIGMPGDRFEREADRVADQVVQRSCACGGTCSDCQSEHVQGSFLDGHAGLDHASVAPDSVDAALRGTGRPLDGSTRAAMESRFHFDFSRVRVHDDALADRSAQAVNARAYTVGSDIVFGAGRFSPATLDGQRLIAHELTHVVQQTGGVASSTSTVQRQPKDPHSERAAAAREAHAVTGQSDAQLDEQTDAEINLKLDMRRRREKRYAWTHAQRDVARIQKAGKLTPEHQREITVKVRFFEGEGRSAYLQTLTPVLSEYPDQVNEILADPTPAAPASEQASWLACDIGQKQFPLLFEDDPSAAKCLDVNKDPEYRNLFDLNISSAVGFAVEGTTWENVEYIRFKVLLVKYRNGASEYFMLDDVGNFYYGGKTLITREFAFLKRTNGLIYPLVNDRIYFNEMLTPNILAYKNGLKYQTKDLQGLYGLLQTAGAFASILASYSGVLGGLKASLEGFRRNSQMSTRSSSRSKSGGGAGARPPGAGSLPGGSTSEEPSSSGVPEPVTDDRPTPQVRPGQRFGEVVAGYRISGDKHMNEQTKTFERDIFMLSRIDMPKKGSNAPIDIGPIMGLTRALMSEAKAAGATRLTIRGWAVGNDNVLGISRLARSLGGSARVTSTTSIEINVPVR